MTTYDAFKEEIRFREEILKNILLCQKDVEFLESTEPNLIQFFSKRPFFARSRVAIFKLLCLELHKLFYNSNNHKFNFTKLLNKIDNNKGRAEWKDSLSRHDIEHIRELIDEANDIDALEGLSIYRDKYLAHTDKKLLDASFLRQELNRLIDIAYEIVNLLRAEVLEENHPIDLYLPEDGFDEIRNLATT